MVLLAIWLTLAPMAQAGQVYRWTDTDGITHYGDQPPRQTGAEVSTIPVFVEPTAIARMRIEPVGDRYRVWADNRLPGPIEVRLDFARHSNTVGDPTLPARATVAADGSALVAVLRAHEPMQPVSFELRMDSLPGNPSAAPQDVQYRLPLQVAAVTGARPRIDQGYGGRFSHHDPENRYAVDFATPIGTPVLAARDGVVMQVESDFDRTGLDRDRFSARANFVRILHDDGAMTLYAHLKPGGVLVRIGQRVRGGQQIGLSGNTGYTTGPHLHFVVQVNRGMRLVSLPFRMSGSVGPLQIDDGSPTPEQL
ncbi:MAG: peptidoglycan DD-metalloendopeptidase family protein [Lysobacter sp.]